MLDVFSSPTLVGRTLGGLPDGTRELVIDLREVTFVDSAGVSAIAHLQHECTTRNVHLHARFGGADRSIHTTVVQVLRRLVPCDD